MLALALAQCLARRCCMLCAGADSFMWTCSSIDPSEADITASAMHAVPVCADSTHGSPSARRTPAGTSLTVAESKPATAIAVRMRQLLANALVLLRPWQVQLSGR